jgi:hypothetical protein
MEVFGEGKSPARSSLEALSSEKILIPLCVNGVCGNGGPRRFDPPYERLERLDCGPRRLDPPYERNEYSPSHLAVRQCPKWRKMIQLRVRDDRTARQEMGLNRSSAEANMNKGTPEQSSHNTHFTDLL